ncbi:hypothetical protein DICPUDRAFT_30795 [Dictyostelium purpureum]|uniref:GATOR1 complex protein NPRL3 C-terminal HTH domain-containing protein n=1 Tax=Dictyostelium purpureum TaxID=5786 RepID=F0ZFX7_DICPU|nr:uncharacterized protein DICPUDRAFT_30795 [Dictyostelium purpureum]EGC37140.1 hypothetical protein DICPUDRAFT_30795 [Dictyostelium purpureum]|eukprot:XP_003286343.1 hypothetical protein DICPUDRAFT_30795 [Dictyostelium purpureum]
MQLSAALKHEQERCNYITKQVHDMLVLREKWLTEQTLENLENKPNHHILTERIVEKSRLACEIRDIYHGLNEKEIVNLRINGWINLHLNLNNPDIYPLYPIRPYHALLAFSNDDSIKLPTYDTTPSLQKLLEVAKPTKNFRDLQLETDIPLTQIYRLASHLVHWRKAKIINMMTRNNNYILRPDSNQDYRELDKKFSLLFPDFRLYDILNRFSVARPLHTHISKILPQYHTQFLSIIGWLLQHDLIVQLFTYVHLMVHTIGINNSNNNNGGSSGNNNSSNNNNGSNTSNATSNSSSSLIYQPTTFPLMPSYLSLKEQAFFDNIDDGSSLYQLFKRLCVYFRGLHHLEEIMWRENINRDQLTKVLKKYKNVLIQVVHEEDDITNSCNLIGKK